MDLVLRTRRKLESCALFLQITVLERHARSARIPEVEMHSSAPPRRILSEDQLRSSLALFLTAVDHTARCRCAIMSSPLTMGTSAQVPYALEASQHQSLAFGSDRRYRHRHRYLTSRIWLFSLRPLRELSKCRCRDIWDGLVTCLHRHVLRPNLVASGSLLRVPFRLVLAETRVILPASLPAR